MSVMFVNNDWRYPADRAVAEITRSKTSSSTSTGAQATGKVEIDLQALKVDLMSFSARTKPIAPGHGHCSCAKKPRIRLEAQIHGGGHERGFRSGHAGNTRSWYGRTFPLAKAEMKTRTSAFTCCAIVSTTA